MNTREVIDVLNDLIETCKDGEYGFRSSAEQVRSSRLSETMLARSSQCAIAADQLRAHVLQLGGRPEDGGTALGAVHRGWVAIKATLSTYDDLAVLEECERGEDAALERYRDAIKEDLPDDVAAVVQRQYEGVKRNHDPIRTLRNQHRATAE